jgi:hypothetical protein
MLLLRTNDPRSALEHIEGIAREQTSRAATMRATTERLAAYT